MAERAWELLTGSGLTLLVTVVLLLVLRPVALEIGLADEPGGRKRHAARVPLIGGIAMMLGVAFGMSLTGLPGGWAAVPGAALLLVVVGVIDDRFDLLPSVRLLAQAVAAMIAVYAAGIVLTGIGDPWPIADSFGVLSPLATGLLIIALVNGFNLLDGIDGLAGGVAFVSLAGLAMIGVGSEWFSVIALLGGAVSGFLLFNLPLERTQAVRTFMGDAGSTTLGFLIACLGIRLSQGQGAAMSPIVGLWLVALPLYELVAAVWRRIREGRVPWTADDKHLHHALVARGISPRRTLAFLLLVAIAFAVVGLLGRWAGVPDVLMLLGWLVGGILYSRITRRPKPVAKWVRDWKQSRSIDTPFVETIVLGSNGGDHSR